MSAKIIRIDLRDYHQGLLSEPAQILSKGGLVVFPTETVYGLGVNAGIPSAVKRLYEVKNIPEIRPFTFHLASAEDVYCHTKNVPRLALRLMKAFWPGPLTLVLPVCKENGDQSWIGLRVPDHIIARDLVKLAKANVIASSANLTGQPPSTEVQTVINAISDKVDVIIDAGPSKIGISSTVIKIDNDNKFEILRDGSVTKEDIQKLNYKMIVFVCSGNTCRSPMAMGLFRKMMADRMKIPLANLENNGYKIASAGTSAMYDSPASSTAVEVMREKGIDIRSHFSRPVTLSMLEDADVIYVMTKGHLTTLKEWAPLSSDKIKLLDPAGGDIEDPIATGKDGYQKCVAKIQKALERIV